MTTRFVYWAGALFSHKDLIGNLLLADAFDRVAAGRWKVLLPQEVESAMTRSDSIRDGDFELLFRCDALVANFDGTDLDSGTVVEFCYAKFLDLPTVLLRTDFRNANDRVTCPDPWNLMCSGFPRSQSLSLNAMAELNDALASADSLGDGISGFCERTARKIVDSLDVASAEQPVFSDDPVRLAAQFDAAIRSAGGTLPACFPPSRIREIVDARIRRAASL